MTVSFQVSQAKRYCENKGARFTQLREKVYALLLQYRGAAGAYDLLDALKLTERNAKPATVYRALDFLQEFGLVHRLESTNAFVACHHFDCTHPVQFLICDHCGIVEEIQSKTLKRALEEQASEHGFSVKKQTIEAHGTCAECQ